MADRTLTFVASAGVRDGVERYLEPVLSAWPAPEMPQILVAADACQLPKGAESGAALVALGRETLLADARELADRLHNAHIPGVLLCATPEAWRPRLQRDGLIVLDAAADPAHLAAMLFALIERQSFVRHISRDLQIASAAQGGLCGEMDRLHEELNLASSVQRQFIPRVLPDCRNLDFASIFRPAGYCSGDIFDIRQADEHRWAFFIADIVGHGVPAALLTMVVARALITRERTDTLWQAIEPSQALARVNRELCAQPEGPQRFATAVYGLIDERTREVTLAGAGHPPPLLVDHTGKSQRIETEGPLMGVFAEAEFPQVTFKLPDDQVLLLYTDGFELAFPDQAAMATGRRELQSPTEHYLRHLAQLATTQDTGKRDLVSAMRRLEELLDRQAGSLHRADDVTALAIAASRSACATSLAA
ncbi:MAG: PP2C family protein-serine/threonine phosphatase [Planctomycetota bacterium]